MTKGREGETIKITINEYNERKTVRGRNRRVLKGYRCFECSAEVEEDVVKELLNM